MLMETKANNLLSIAMALLSTMGHVSGQCVSVSNVAWYPCGSASTDSSCDRASLSFYIDGEADCVSSNPIVTVDFAGPIVTDGFVAMSDAAWMPGDVSDDHMSVTFDTMADLEPQYYEDGGGSYFWNIRFDIDNCDTNYIWEDNFVQLFYADDENNIIDVSAFENPEYIDDPDTGVCDGDMSFFFTFDDWNAEDDPYFSSDDTPSAAPIVTAPAPTTQDGDMSFSFSFEEWDDDEKEPACISAPYLNWYPCGSSYTDTCDQAYIDFNILRQDDCVSTNAIVTVEYSGPIAKSATIYDSDTREQIPGIVSDDQRSVTIDMSAATPRYSSYYYWNLRLDINNCDASYTRGDNFVQLSYVDDEENIIDLSGFETPSFIDGPDTGVCADDDLSLSYSF